jgi:flagellar protein FlaG
MDIAALRQSFTAVPVMPVRPDVFAPAGSVATELPAGQTVSPPREAAPTRNDVSRHADLMSRLGYASQRQTEQRFERDRKTEVLVFKQVDPSTGEVIMQLPDQSLLNLRAYLRDQQEAAPHEVEKSA